MNRQTYREWSSRYTEQSLKFAARKASCTSLTMELVANALVYVGGYLFLVFMAVCLATGA